jgi:hypothetical protein
LALSVVPKTEVKRGRPLAELTPEERTQRRKENYTRYHRTEKHQIVRRRSQYKKNYGITLEEYDAMLLAQNGVCKICGNKETHKGAMGRPKPLCVDHCHATGKVRGLLCNDCNQVLGRAKDNTETLKKAIKYLKESRLGLE